MKRWAFRATFSGVTFSLLTVLAGCGGDSGTSSDAVVKKMRSCDLLSDGRVTSDAPYPGDDCYNQCLLDASCNDLAGLVCGAGPTTGISACWNDCVFTCADGSTVSADYECDGTPDCSDGSDEHDGCGRWLFDCGNGNEVPRYWICDDYDDCGNSADEADCSDADFFDCGDGTRIPDEWQCDLDVDCSNGSDETGCAQPLCGG